jgi:DNA-binding NarL/FixJ family response regulator
MLFALRLAYLLCQICIGVIVSSKRVAIISSRGIFRDGLKHLLAKVALVELVDSIEEVEDLIHKQQVDVVIIDRAEDQMTDDKIVSRLLSVPGIRVITVSLEADDMRIYQHSKVGEASVEDLVAAVLD